MFCNLVITNTLSSIIRMHNLYANFVKTFDICKFFSKDLVNSVLISLKGQGMFEGAVSDNFDERIDQKIFHAEIVVDIAKVSTEMKVYQSIPTIADFKTKMAPIISKKLLKPTIVRRKRNIVACECRGQAHQG